MLSGSFFTICKKSNFYDLSGKLVRRSASFAWISSPNHRDQHKNEEKEATALFWAPGGDKLLVSNGDHTGIYDAHMDKLVILQAKAPLVFGDTPIRPDGTAFLVMTSVKQGNRNAGVALVDWEGKQRPVRVEARGWDTRDNLLESAYLVGRWENNIATVEDSEGFLRIDTDKRSGSYQETKPSGAAKQGDMIRRREYVFPQSGMAIRVAYFQGGNDQYCEVDAFKRTNPKRNRVLLRASIAQLFPAPNRKLLAILVWPEKEGDPTIHVFNDQAETVTIIVLKDSPMSRDKKVTPGKS
jgi:hypothetical protein